MTAGVRSALCRAPPGPLCCQWAELAAMVRLAGGLRVTNSGTLSVVTELPTAQAAERLCTTAHAHTTAEVTVLVHPTADRRCTVAITPGRDLAMRSGLLDRRGRPVLGLPPAVLQGGRCDAAAVWRGALLATAEPPNPGRRRHGLTVPCPNTLVAVALVGLARRLGATAHVSTHHGREHTHLTDPTAIATLLTAAGGPATATAWHHDHPTPPDATTAGALRPGFAAANSHRARAAATLAAAQITHAFTTLGPDTIPAPLRQAGQLRLDHPELSIAELAALTDPPLTKDTLAGRLRRLLALANQTSTPRDT
jgi:DNA-binding protein WhiA